MAWTIVAYEYRLKKPTHRWNSIYIYLIEWRHPLELHWAFFRCRNGFYVTKLSRISQKFDQPITCMRGVITPCHWLHRHWLVFTHWMQVYYDRGHDKNKQTQNMGWPLMTQIRFVETACGTWQGYRACCAYHPPADIMFSFCFKSTI